MHLPDPTSTRARSDGFVGLRDGSRQLGVLLQAAWFSREEGLLDKGVQIAIGHHEGEPSVIQDGGEELPHT